jgi:hypothetical protein
MTTMSTDRLVDDYMRRLETAAAHLQASRRAELVAQIREHVETALRQEDAADETVVRNVLERLGPPEEIVEAEDPSPPVTDGRAGPLEITALVVLVVLPVVGWLVGSVLVAVSRAWTARDKVIGIALAVLPLVLPLFTLVIGAESGADHSVPVGDPRPVGVQESSGVGDLGAVELFFVFLFGGLPSALFLALRLRRR